MDEPFHSPHSIGGIVAAGCIAGVLIAICVVALRAPKALPVRYVRLTETWTAHGRWLGSSVGPVYGSPYACRQRLAAQAGASSLSTTGHTTRITRQWCVRTEDAQ